jgi:hypothetical protein
MAKTNYSKVEKLLVDGIRRLKTEQLLEIADKAALAHRKNVAPATEPSLPLPSESAVHATIRGIKRDLKAIEAADPETFATLGSDQESVSTLVPRLAEFSQTDWDQLVAVREKIEAIRREVVGVTESQQLDLQIQGEFDKLEVKGKYDFHSKDKWRPV